MSCKVIYIVRVGLYENHKFTKFTIHTYIHIYFAQKMTREVRSMNSQYGARRTMLRKRLLPPLTKDLPYPSIDNI